MAHAHAHRPFSGFHRRSGRWPGLLRVPKDQQVRCVGNDIEVLVRGHSQQNTLLTSF